MWCATPSARCWWFADSAIGAPGARALPASGQSTLRRIHLKPQDFAAGSAAHHGADENFREGVFRNFVWEFKFEVPGDEPDATGGRHIASTSPSDLSGEASMRRYGFALLVA